MLHALGCFFILLVLLGFQSLGEITFPIAVELGLVAVFAQNAGNVRFVGMIIRDGSPRTDNWQQRCKEEDINQRYFHE